MQLTRNGQKHFFVEVTLLNGNIGSGHFLEQYIRIWLHPENLHIKRIKCLIDHINFYSCIKRNTHFTSTLTVICCKNRSSNLYKVQFVHIVMYRLQCTMPQSHLRSYVIYTCTKVQKFTNIFRGMLLLWRKRIICYMAVS